MRIFLLANEIFFFSSSDFKSTLAQILLTSCGDSGFNGALDCKLECFFGCYFRSGYEYSPEKSWCRGCVVDKVNENCPFACRDVFACQQLVHQGLKLFDELTAR